MGTQLAYVHVAVESSAWISVPGSLPLRALYLNQNVRCCLFESELGWEQGKWCQVNPNVCSDEFVPLSPGRSTLEIPHLLWLLILCPCAITGPNHFQFRKEGNLTVLPVISGPGDVF